MDPISAAALSAVLVPLATGAAGEAGKLALDRLVTFVRDRFGRGSPAAEAGTELIAHPAEEPDAPRLAVLLEQAAADEDDVADWLRGWMQSSAPLVGAPTEVSNIVAGQARVSGPVIQAHTISGPITFGPPAP
ncbi:hypothetical protein [Cryptosporangium aurantiacum]|uniref:Uncharacterized protein n=1 Tax=Cryptosporangium aurantiacum TaxID=134849 RepID=A0A1M7QFP1_9ACTN|nr:hypothetical protein [Cryptosporangium aurantiacum]SHN29845.1 hypothetical protein SAMN05443668_104617 [Cryptosporangium aurantiacum]